MTQYEHCAHCLHNLDLQQHSVLSAALQQLQAETDQPCLQQAVQERACQLAGCLD